MKVLVACEESQRVCIAFRERGHEAYSCDIQDCSGGHPEWHIKGDCIAEIMRGYDLIIAHPPCTYLSNAATRSFSTRVTPAEKVIKRWEERAKAAVFFMRILESDCPRICVENPVGFMNTAYRKPDQIIHPWMWATSEADTENYKTKRTCLWLKGLPLLKPNGLCEPPNNAETYGRRKGSGKVRNWCEDCIAASGEERAKLRSKTFPGIAAAFAEQWG